MHSMSREEGLEAARQKIRDLERALTVARKAADVATAAANLARQSQATAWRVAFGRAESSKKDGE